MCQDCLAKYRTIDPKLITKLEEQREKVMEVAMQIVPELKPFLFKSIPGVEDPVDANVAPHILMAVCAYIIGERHPSREELNFSEDQTSALLSIGLLHRSYRDGKFAKYEH